MSNIFKKAAQRAKNFIKDTKKTLRTTKSTIIKDFKRKYTGKKQAKNFLPGTMLSFHYDAIDSDKKFDKAPLVICLGLSRDNKKHFLGLNLNWMPQSKRVLLASLVTEMLEKKKGRLVYEDVKPLIKKFEGSPILRRYAIRRVSSKIIQMPTDVFLSAARFTGPDFNQKS